MSNASGWDWLYVAVPLVLTVAVVWGLWRLLFPGKGADMVCTTCGHHGAAKSHTRGSMLVEIVLWLLFLLPGLIYSLWRVSTRRRVCAACGGTALVPPDTPAGKRMLQDSAR